jgi:micrococcal nuclease
MTARWLARITLVALAITAAACRGGGTDVAVSLDAGPATATVVRVIDGDTLDLSLSGQRVRVRLIGIDTPETKDENRPVQCYGAEASNFVEQLLPKGTAVRVERDVEPRDKYDRLLVYLYRSADELFVNAELVRDGYATTLTIAPNTVRAPEFEVLKAQAQREHRGLWGACPAFGSPADATTTTRGR